MRQEIRDSADEYGVVVVDVEIARLHQAGEVGGGHVGQDVQAGPRRLDHDDVRALVDVDGLDVSWTPPPLVPCFTSSVDTGVAPITVDFDASCTESLSLPTCRL